VQVNHSAAIDEGGKLRSLGRLHVDLEGRPFANAGQFRMEHDLRKSVITAIAETPDGPVKVEIRAHVPHDAICIDVADNRRNPGPLTVRLEEDAASKDEFNPEHGLRLWHENPAAGAALQEAMASELEGSVFRGLSGRAFGLTVLPTLAEATVSGRTMTLPASARHTLYVVGVSTPGGIPALAEALTQALAGARSTGDDGFRETHAAWWDSFWRRSQVVIPDPSGGCSGIRRPSICTATIWPVAPASVARRRRAFRSICSAIAGAFTIGRS
jgi:hypothetical protein